MNLFTTAYYHLDLRLRPNQLYNFRGAFIDMAVKSDILDDDEVSLLANRAYDNGSWLENLHQFPHVQYRIEDQRAVLFGINNGVDVIEKLIHHHVLVNFEVQGNLLPLSVVSAYKQDRIIKRDKSKCTYLLFHYLPFNTYDDHDYHRAPLMADKIKVLEDSINHGIKGLLDLSNSRLTKVEVDLIDIISKDKAAYRTKDQNGKPYKEELVSYFIKFRCDIEGLDQLSIGKHKSLGYGVIKKVI